MRPVTLLKTLCAGFGLGVIGFAQSVAFTFDVGPRLAPTPRLSAAERINALTERVDSSRLSRSLLGHDWFLSVSKTTRFSSLLRKGFIVP